MAATASTGLVSRTCAKTGSGEVGFVELPVPDPAPHGVVLRTRMATICGSDLHMVDDFPMPRGAEFVPLGHEGVAEVVAVGADVRGFAEGDRVIASCAYGCGTCRTCRSGQTQLCETYGKKLPAMANMLAGAQGDHYSIPHADVNMAKVPDDLPDELAILATDIMSTGFAAVERAGMRPGDTVAVFAQGPVGLCATAGARALGAGLVIAVERVPERVEMAKRMGANVVLDPEDAVEAIRDLTGGRGVDVAIEALGLPATFHAALEVCRIDGTVSSVGVYAREKSLPIPVDAKFYQRRIVTSLCPCGADRLQQLLAILRHGGLPLGEMFTHRLPLSQTVEAYDLFRERRDGVMKIALVPDA